MTHLQVPIGESHHTPLPRQGLPRDQLLEESKVEIAAEIETSEEWRSVIGFSDYQVSSRGRIRCQARRRYLRPGDIISLHVLRDGYVVACIDGKNRCVHRLVCQAFHGDPPSPKHEVAHNDGNCSNNTSENLRWATHKENCADKKIHGTENPPRGEQKGNSKLCTDDVKEIRQRLANGEGVVSISRDFGVSHGTIGFIKSGRNWSHV
jgi:hypothetical protein